MNSSHESDAPSAAFDDLLKTFRAMSATELAASDPTSQPPVLVRVAVRIVQLSESPEGSGRAVQ